jgi:nickel/cobalt exporter
MAVAWLALNAPSASGHPIGNFTLNLYSGIEVAPGRVQIHYVMEMAEISTQEQKPGMDLDEDGEITAAERDSWADRASTAILTNLSMIANGQPVELRLADSSLRFRTGQGGLDLIYMEADFEGVLPSSGRVDYADGNYADRPGWREITVRAATGMAITDATVPDRSVSDELKAYPPELTQAPLNVREAGFGFQASSVPTEPEASPSQGGGSTSPAGSGGFADLLATSADRAIGVLFALAFGFGFVHALGPGHGKTVMAASALTGSVRLRHTLWLGGGVALMHCASVIALGLIALAASRTLSSETVYTGLRLITAVVVMVVGAVLLAVRWRQRHRTHEVGHGHEHGHEHGGSSDSASRVSGTDRAGIAAVAASGGLLPSPSAVVVMLGAIAADRIPLGVALVVTFSLGLATALVLAGVLSVYAKTWVRRFEVRATRWLPIAAAAAIFTVGVILTVQAIGSIA